jgi:hypothetical protein
MAIDFTAPLAKSQAKKRKAQAAEVPAVQEPTQFPDAESVRKGLTKYDPLIDAIAVRAERLEVKDAAGRAEAVAILSDAKNLFKTIEALRESLKAPALEYGRVVDKTASYFKDRLAKAETTAKNKDLVYKQGLDRQQAIKDAAAREEARKLQAKIDEENRLNREEAERKVREAETALKKEKDAAARALLERTIQEETAAAQAPAPQVVAPVIEAPPKNVKTEFGTLSYTKKWKCRLVDETKVEARFKVVDIRLAQKAVDNGERNLPGFEVYEDETSRARV